MKIKKETPRSQVCFLYAPSVHDLVIKSVIQIDAGLKTGEKK